MGDVYDKRGRRVGSVNVWSGVFDTNGRKAGSINIYTDRVSDAAGRTVGTADSHGTVCDTSGRVVCNVSFFGRSVKTPGGSVIGQVGVAGAPDPHPDMQWRGAAALLLLVLREPSTLEKAFDYIEEPTYTASHEYIQAGSSSVRPLVEALSAHLYLYGENVRSKRDQDRIKAQISEIVLLPFVRPVHDIIGQIDGAAREMLVIQSSPDKALRKTAALLLSLHEQPHPELASQLASILKHGDIDDTSTAMLLTITLALWGGRNARVGYRRRHEYSRVSN